MAAVDALVKPDEMSSEPTTAGEQVSGNGKSQTPHGTRVNDMNTISDKAKPGRLDFSKHALCSEVRGLKVAFYAADKNIAR
jgi:hypothetical protein